MADETDRTAPHFAAALPQAAARRLAVVLFFAAWQAIFLVVPFNPLFISKPSLIAAGYVDLIESGDLVHDLAVSSVPFFSASAPPSSSACRSASSWVARARRLRARSADDRFYASPLVALAPLLVIFFGVGVAGKTIIVFFLSVFPFIFNASAGVRAVDRLLINVVRSLGGGEWDLYRKVMFPSVLPYMVAGARIAVGRALDRRSGR